MTRPRGGLRALSPPEAAARFGNILVRPCSAAERIGRRGCVLLRLLMNSLQTSPERAGCSTEHER